jgi:predicted XRE-type DNA-binding protein
MATKTKLDAKRSRVTREIKAIRVKMAAEIARILKDRSMTQTEASYVSGEAPSQISLVCTGKLRGFSLERLLRMRILLGAEIEVRVTSSTAASITAKFN